MLEVWANTGNSAGGTILFDEPVELASIETINSIGAEDVQRMDLEQFNQLCIKVRLLPSWWKAHPHNAAQYLKVLRAIGLRRAFENWGIKLDAPMKNAF